MSRLVPSVWLLAGGVVVLLAFAIYRASIPKPIPGVPHNKDAAARPFGDIPTAVRWHAATGELGSFFKARIKELDSPIIQMFMRPFGKPWIVIADSREAQDIMVRRTKEFDRSPFLADLIKAVAPFNQVTMATTEQWRSHRRLMSDTMAPNFLHNVAAVQVYAAFADLADLWRTKAKLAQGHPFDANEDTQEAMLDAITDAAFSAALGASRVQNSFLSKLPMLDELAEDNDSVAIFPRAKPPTTTSALQTLAQSSEIPMNSPLGYHHHKFATMFHPSLRRAIAIKDKLITDKLEEAWQRFTELESAEKSQSSEDHITSAADLIVSKEVKLAKKDGRLPQHDSHTVQDELFGFVEAGHDTTGTTIQWGLKFVAAHPEKQERLRKELRSVFRDAANTGAAPKAADIASCRIPYLDAFIEEVLRVGNTAVMNTRVATQETEILGHRIPKGTNVFMMTSGPSLTAPAMHIDKSKRGVSHAHLPLENPWVGNWDESTLGEFQPDRWLMPNEKGELEFEPRAGPQQNFGAGLRGCFGRRLAMLSLRIVFTLMVWNFEFQQLPGDLGDFKAKDVLTHRPQQLFVRLVEAAA